MVKRLRAAEKQVKAMFRAIPRTSTRQTQIVNAERVTVYDYDYDPQIFSAATQSIINEQLLETDDGVMPFFWFWKTDIELPYRQGTTEELRDFNQLIAGAIAAGTLVNGFPPQVINIEEVLLSPDYRQTLGDIQGKNFTTVKGLSDKVSAQVIQRVNDGIAAGQSPTKIAQDITDRFEVAESDAKRISNTEVNKAYTDAKINAAKLAEKRTGLRAAVLHVSALTPTTRSWHAARHGKAYRPDDQLRWWNQGANRINCKCSVTTVLIDRKGRVINTGIQDNLIAQRPFFDDA